MTLIFKFVNFLDYITRKLPKAFKYKLLYQSNNEHPIYISDNLFFRKLNFENSATQSRVCKLTPSTPALTSVRLLSFAGELYKLVLNHCSKNKNILILGLGGGDLLRYYNKWNSFYNYSYKITAVEKSKEIIEIAKKYFYLNQIKSKFLIKHDDAYDFILRADGKKYSIITVDFFTELDSAISLLKEDYLYAICNKLDTDSGILVLNILVTNQQIFTQFIINLKKFFNNQILIAESPTHYNIIIYAFNSSEYLQSLVNTQNNTTKYYINNLTFNSQHGFYTALFNN